MCISKDAIIGKNVTFGHNVVIEKDAVIGDNVIIGHNVVIHSGTIIGSGSVISDNTVLGKKPFKASTSATTEDKELKPLKIGNFVTMGANCVIYKGAILEDFVFVGDLASIREEVRIGKKTIIGRGVTVENKTRIGKYVKIETEAYITALSVVEDYCFIAPEVTFTNDNFLGRTEKRKKFFKGPIIRKGARIGANATILPGVIVEEDALVAAGSVVTKNVPAKKIVAGVPAKVLKDVPDEQLLINQTYYKK
ncbi:UDP-3-O-(3-hydroxymyristoyl) glucosamine N-acyltransferase [Thermosipho sp. 1063]|uniref:acyltransferase n=1 Tax=unclassified Thermosipho (in: thermotogales) TaxID=2676525 RepID=UPI0009494786|nr:MULTISPECIES: N-acetyltransferase [unclassified Thermosipho (in: thermotogales)]ANQ53632.1 UDP-3-O-(3-hydroxymyristoyl) glucosamine N-acyltransferase [Thermosipho sp. 1070]APT72078.1 UDP-3-O-(3-hydroxymyristoyl) glucosamine N-acyltransferase [Thermosipho sp. 1063]OOC44190.1 UDP-3-O-(3-hydroxymyristoyl) glucosamine N-acyltransferase [Thermosipho sp. 1074]